MAAYITARQLGLMQSFDRYAVAIDAELYVSDKQLGRQGEKAHFDFHHVPKGYAWIFPKADHLSIGVFTTFSKAPGMPRISSCSVPMASKDTPTKKCRP